LCSKKSINLSVFIPPFSYKSQCITPFTEIANIPVYFLNTSDGDYCSLVMLTAQKSISSIGIFDFPYLASDYKSGMRPKYLINWRIDNALNRLYIYLDGKTYIFERGYCGKKSGIDGDTITTNAFFITNIISFLLGKLLEKAIHL
jgi:hypothetical protein